MGGDPRTEGRRGTRSRRRESKGSAGPVVLPLDPASVDLHITLGALYLKNRNTIDAETQARFTAEVRLPAETAENYLRSTPSARTNLRVSTTARRPAGSATDKRCIASALARARARRNASEEILAVATETKKQHDRYHALP